MTAARPTASGTLGQTSFLNLLVYVLDRKLSGSLVLETPTGGRSALQLDKGVPVKAKTSEPVIHLGKLLVETKAITESTLNETLARVAQERRLHGQVLLSTGAIDEATLRDALIEQLERKIAWMYELPPETRYGYYDQVNFLEKWGGAVGVPVDPLAALWRGFRQTHEASATEKSVRIAADRQMKLHYASQVGRFAFDNKESTLVNVLRAKPYTLPGLVATGLLSPELTKAILHVLIITRHIDLGAGDPVGVDIQSGAAPHLDESKSVFQVASQAAPRRVNPDAAKTRPASPHAAGIPGVEPSAAELTDEQKEFAAEAKRIAETIDKQNYYEVLGIPAQSAIAEVQKAFFALAKIWHPDRIAPELAHLHDDVTHIFARISEAHQVLADETRREEYHRLMKEGGASSEEQEAVQQVLRAAMNFQKAEVLLKKHDMAGAEKHAKLAYEQDPEQVDYAATYAWLQARKPGVEAADMKPFIVLLDQAIGKEPDNVRARRYRAELLKRAGETRKALADFKWLVERNPHDVDAQREIRLWEMRRRSDQGGRTTDPRRTGGKTGRTTGGRRTNPRRTGGGGDKDEKDGSLLNSDLSEIWGKLFKR